MSLSPHLGGGWYLQTELKIPGAQLCCLITNQSKRVTNPAALTPNVASSFWSDDHPVRSLVWPLSISSLRVPTVSN